MFGLIISRQINLPFSHSLFSASFSFSSFVFLSVSFSFRSYTYCFFHSLSPGLSPSQFYINVLSSPFIAPHVTNPFQEHPVVVLRRDLILYHLFSSRRLSSWPGNIQCFHFLDSSFCGGCLLGTLGLVMPRFVSKIYSL